MKPAEPGIPTQSDTLLATCLVLLACACFGTIPFFAKSLTDAGMAPYAVAFYRYGLTALLLFPLLRVPADQRGALLWGLLAGASIGLGWIGFVSALETVPVSNLGVLYMTYPVFTLLIGWLWFRDRPAGLAVVGASLVLIAAAIAASPAAVEPRHLPAMLVSLGAPISFGFGINVLIHKLAPLRPRVRVASFTCGASLGLLPLLLLSEAQAVLPRQSGDWLLIAGLALLTALIPQLIYPTFAPQIGAARSAVAGAVELPTMFVVGWLLLGEKIGALEWGACGLVTLAVLVTPARASSNIATRLVMPRSEKKRRMTPPGK